MTMIILGFVILAFVVGIFYAGAKILMLPFRLAFFVIKIVFNLINAVLTVLFKSPDKKEG